MLIASPPHPTPPHRGAALRFAPFAQPAGAQANRRRPTLPARHHPTIQPPPYIRKCSAGYSPALAHLKSTISAMRATRSTAPACRCIRFTSLRFHSAPSDSAVQRKRNQVGASLRSRSLRARMPTDDDLHWPQPAPDQPSRHAG